MWRKTKPTQKEPRPEKIDRRIKVGWGQAVSMIYFYARKRIVDRIKSVSFIVVYLILLQVLILRQPILDAAVVAAGIACVVMGLAFFIEGLFLGVMPLG